MNVTPANFTFQFKIFGLFTTQVITKNALPNHFRHLLKPNQQNLPSNAQIQWKNMSSQLQQALWDYQNQSLKEVYDEGKLGFVVFQYHLSFRCNDVNRQYVEYCRQKLDPRFRMAVELRCREWSSDNQLLQTIEWLKGIDCVWVVEDDLIHETYTYKQVPPPNIDARLPIILRVASPLAIYIRLHRRQGTQRILKDVEFDEYASRLHDLLAKYSTNEFNGPIIFVWGTDHENQPMVNMTCLREAIERYEKHQSIPEAKSLLFDWPKYISTKDEPVNTSLLQFFKPNTKRDKIDIKDESLASFSKSNRSSQQTSSHNDNIFTTDDEITRHSSSNKAMQLNHQLHSNTLFTHYTEVSPCSKSFHPQNTDKNDIRIEQKVSVSEQVKSRVTQSLSNMSKSASLVKTTNPKKLSASSRKPIKRITKGKMVNDLKQTKMVYKKCKISLIS